MKKLLTLLPLLAVLALASPAYAGQSNHHKCHKHCYKPSPSPIASASATPDTKGDGPTGVENTTPERINSPTASNGAGIGGASK